MTQEIIKRARDAIVLARRELDRGDGDSFHLANYALRDLQATKDAGLSDLSWAMHENNLCKNDVLALIEYLEKYLEGLEQ